MRKRTETELTLLNRWERSGYPRPVGEALLNNYREIDRHYHTAEHLLYMFHILDTDSKAQVAWEQMSPFDRKALELAVWYHDIHYAPEYPDNEMQSALRFLADAASLGVARPLGKRIANLILVSRSHAPKRDDTTAELFCDLDLAILGETPDVYSSYKSGIREEYAYLTPPVFMWKRRHFLVKLLKRQRLFHILTDREGPTRRNLSGEQASLSFDHMLRAAMELWQGLRLWEKVFYFIVGPVELLFVVLTSLVPRNRPDSRTFLEGDVPELLSRAADKLPTAHSQEERDPGEFRPSSHGLRVELEGETMEVPWSAVEYVVAYKRDCWGFDLICLDITDLKWTLRFNEHQRAWDWLIHELDLHLDGMPNPEEWFFKVAFPPFAPCTTVLYKKLETLQPS